MPRSSPEAPKRRSEVASVHLKKEGKEGRAEGSLGPEYGKRGNRCRKHVFRHQENRVRNDLLRKTDPPQEPPRGDCADLRVPVKGPSLVLGRLGLAAVVQEKGKGDPQVSGLSVPQRSQCVLPYVAFRMILLPMLHVVQDRELGPVFLDKPGFHEIGKPQQSKSSGKDRAEKFPLEERRERRGGRVVRSGGRENRAVARQRDRRHSRVSPISGHAGGNGYIPRGARPICGLSS